MINFSEPSIVLGYQALKRQNRMICGGLTCVILLKARSRAMFLSMISGWISADGKFLELMNTSDLL